MKNILFIIFFTCVIKVSGQCTFSITPTYTPPTCSSCCDGIISFTVSGSGFCSPSSQTLISSCCGYPSPSGIWNNLCAGSYTIKVMDGCACLGICGFSLSSPTAINEFSEGSGVKIYPNPATDVINIEFLNSNYKQETAIEISDLTGRIVYITKQQLSADSLTLHPDLSNGTYLVKIKLSDGTLDVHRLVISK